MYGLWLGLLYSSDAQDSLTRVAEMFINAWVQRDEILLEQIVASDFHLRPPAVDAEAQGLSAGGRVRKEEESIVWHIKRF